MPTCNVKVISQFNFKNYGAGFITMRRVIHWFRRDLRVTDNTALWHACDQADEVIPVYILSTWKKRHPWTGPNRQEFLCGCLESLSKNLEAIGGCLILRAGDPVQELGKLVNETHAKAIFSIAGRILAVSRSSSRSKRHPQNYKFRSSATKMSRFLNRTRY